jgi:predicted PhzF superfamily epimerase YddE/YHI9
VRQGEHVSRPSTLQLDVGEEGTVHVGGQVREVGGGEVRL